MTTHKTDKPISMPARGDRPGHKIGRNNLRYWIAGQVLRDTKGFPFKCIPLPVRADNEAEAEWEQRISELCRRHTADLLAWVDNPKAGEAEPEVRYDGRFGSLCRIYKSHKHSPYHRAKKNTRRYYDAYLDLIEATIGQKLVARADIFFVQHCYAQWRQPAKAGLPERIDRAHDGVSMLRTVVNFCARLKGAARKDCKELASDLEGEKFEKGGAREQEMTFAYVRDFIHAAHHLVYVHKVPLHRARYLAIGVAAQFDLLLRQKDVIGERHDRDDIPKLPKGVAQIPCGDKLWTGFFVWENFKGWRWRMKTSKSKYRSAADFDLTRYGLLFPLLEATPHTERTGAVVKGEGGLPAKESTYRQDFRPIARAAGIPDAVWNMDTRAGGATEADEAEAEISLIQAGLTHTEPKTTVRYLRRGSSKKLAKLAEVRAGKRAAEAGGES